MSVYLFELKPKPMKSGILIIILLSITFFTTAQCVEGDCVNGYGREVFDDHTYSGFYKDGLFDGWGLVKYSNGDVFKGAFAEGKVHGVGILIFGSTDRSVYAEFEDGELNGYGFILEGGDVAEANKYKDGKVVKRMELDYVNNVTRGLCRGNCTSGFGLEAYEPGNYYFGFFTNNAYRGVGVRVFGNGGVYKGGLHKSKRSGFGEYTYPSGNVYIGMWKGGERHGPGAFIYTDGSEKIGYFKNGEYIGMEE